MDFVDLNDRAVMPTKEARDDRINDPRHGTMNSGDTDQPATMRSGDTDQPATMRSGDTDQPATMRSGDIDQSATMYSGDTDQFSRMTSGDTDQFAMMASFRSYKRSARDLSSSLAAAMCVTDAPVRAGTSPEVLRRRACRAAVRVHRSALQLIHLFRTVWPAAMARAIAALVRHDADVGMQLASHALAHIAGVGQAAAGAADVQLIAHRRDEVQTVIAGLRASAAQFPARVLAIEGCLARMHGGGYAALDLVLTAHDRALVQPDVYLANSGMLLPPWITDGLESFCANLHRTNDGDARESNGPATSSCVRGEVEDEEGCESSESESSESCDGTSGAIVASTKTSAGTSEANRAPEADRVEQRYPCGSLVPGCTKRRHCHVAVSSHRAVRSRASRMASILHGPMVAAVLDLRSNFTVEDVACHIAREHEFGVLSRVARFSGPVQAAVVDMVSHGVLRGRSRAAGMYFDVTTIGARLLASGKPAARVFVGLKGGAGEAVDSDEEVNGGGGGGDDDDDDDDTVNTSDDEGNGGGGDDDDTVNTSDDECNGDNGGGGDDDTRNTSDAEANRGGTEAVCSGNEANDAFVVSDAQIDAQVGRRGAVGDGAQIDAQVGRRGAVGDGAQNAQVDDDAAASMDTYKMRICGVVYTSPADGQWLTNLRWLHVYVRCSGNRHLRVDTSPSYCPGLGQWVSNELRGAVSIPWHGVLMQEIRVRMLSDRVRDSFLQNVLQLKAFIAKHGHASLPRNTHMGAWLRHQREAYRAERVRSQGRRSRCRYRMSLPMEMLLDTHCIGWKGLVLVSQPVHVR